MKTCMKISLYLLLVSPLFSIFAMVKAAGVITPPLILGAIQFPRAVSKVSHLPIFCAGRRVKTEIDEEGKKLTFELPKSPLQTKFHIIITEGIEFKVSKKHDADSNNVKYIKIKDGSDYRLFVCELISETNTEDVKQPISYRWEISEHVLTHPKKRIPDAAIIIYYNPEFIEKLETKHAFELPTIVIKQDLLDQLGSERVFQHISNRHALAAIDINTIHVKHEQAIKMVDSKRTLVAITT